jgi:hypothetical protein
MMREAQKMMQDPAFKKKMQDMMKAPQFQTALKQTQESMSDPEKVKELEEKARLALEEGTKKLEEIEKARALRGDAEDTKPAAKETEEDEQEEIPNLGLN